MWWEGSRRVRRWLTGRCRNALSQIRTLSVGEWSPLSGEFAAGCRSDNSIPGGVLKRGSPNCHRLSPKFGINRVSTFAGRIFAPTSKGELTAFVEQTVAARGERGDFAGRLFLG